MLWGFLFDLLATFQVQELKLNFTARVFLLNVTCVNALGVNNTCDIRVIFAGNETEICHFTAIASEAHSCKLPQHPETAFLVLAYDEGYSSEPAVTKLFVTPEVDDSANDS